ncbi:tubulin polyglutamylase TTLL11-like isoform X2 [Saccostrea echinata]|uniref:tubulin polyglutamylase TTLL11-like isoform X2 n=1 Tax=Saccostrea echinata TaxID=191078 RepID=UPI002A836465|nr:tubulin polyglutamylase TTLL11-like isoform X2 [Saccostrea echinata]
MSVSSPKRERTRFIRKRISKHAVTIDTSKAKSNADVVRMCVKELGLVEYPNGRKDAPCDIYWNEHHFDDNPAATGGKVNKFPEMENICSKMTLFKCLDIMRDLYPSDFDFYPRTWYLPAQFEEFSSEVQNMKAKRKKLKSTFIIKPYGGSSGEGIFLLKEPKDYISSYPSKRGMCHVAQEYMANVYLIDDFKFDFRIYVVLKSVEPLEFHICSEGLARFSTVPYQSPTKKNMHETFMHLTNYSLNKRSKDFSHSEEDDEGSKRSLSSVLKRIDMNGQDSVKVWRDIELVVCKTIIAIVPELKVAWNKTFSSGKPCPSCFQVLGFDILLLSDLKPVLLEINGSPSLYMDSEQEVSPGVMKYVRNPKDEEVKFPLIRDTILLMMSPHKRKHCEKKRRKRMMHLQKLKSSRESLLARPSSEVMTCIQAYDDKEDIEELREEEEGQEDYMNQQLSEFHIDEEYSTGNTDEAKGTENHHSDNDQEQKDEIQLEHQDPDDLEEHHLEDSCLKQLYPDLYQEECDQFRILERAARLYINCIGVKKSPGMSSSAFRTFIRKCQLNKKGLTNAAVDIMYIDLQRRWDQMNPESSSTCLSFQAFLDACFEITKNCFSAPTKIEMLEGLLSYCESHISFKENET